MSSNWYYYERDLEKYGKELAAVQYDPLGIELKKPQPTYGYYSIHGTNSGPLMAGHVRALLKQLTPPHGYELLKTASASNLSHSTLATEEACGTRAAHWPFNLEAIWPNPVRTRP